MMIGKIQNQYFVSTNVSHSEKCFKSHWFLLTPAGNFFFLQNFGTFTFCKIKGISDNIWRSKHIFLESSMSGDENQLKFEYFSPT